MDAQVAQFLDGLFADMSELRLRESGLEAVRGCVGAAPAGAMPFVHYSEWHKRLVLVLAPDLRAEHGDPRAMSFDRVRPHLVPTVGVGASYAWRDVAPRVFWSWMLRAGLAVKIDDSERWVLTKAGLQRLESDHPCRPGALERLRAAVGTTFDDSLARLDDALACLDAGLPRPAVVLLGLAYEELFSLVLAHIELKEVAKLKGMASERQELLRKRLQNHPDSDARSKALLALNVADSIRDERNKAAHTAAGQWDPAEVEELVSAGIGAYAKLALYEAKP